MQTSLTQLYKNTRQEGECRIWQGATQNNIPKLNPKYWGMAYARQWAYCSQGKDLEKCKTLRNICKNTLCVNPAHLTYEPDRSGLLEEFLSYVDKEKGLSPDNKKSHLGNCHWWTAAKTKAGNNDFQYGALNKDKWGETLAHRWIYKIANNIPELNSKRTVNHLCNNTLCVNPTHLSYAPLGEIFNKTNINQAIEEKRIRGQVFHPSDVPIIREKILAGEKVIKLMTDYHCSKTCILDIKFNRTYKDPSYTPPKK